MRTRPRLLVVMAIGALLGAPSLAAAATASAGPVPAMAGPASGSPGLQAAPAPSAPPRPEGLPAPSAVTVGFIALWTLLLGLVVLLSRRDQQLTNELHALQRELEPAAAPSADDPPKS